MTPSALIFDVDGTLTETAEIHRNAFNTAFRDIGVDWHWSVATFTRLSGLPTDHDRVQAYMREFRPAEAQAALGRDLADRAVARKRGVYRRLIENGVARLRPGVARLMREAHNARIPLAIATVSARSDFEQLLQNHFDIDVARMFHTIVTAEDLGPAPTADNAYATAVAGLGAHAVNAVAFDDSAAGADAAARNGLTVIAVPGIYTSSDDFSRAALVISDLGHPAAPFQVIRGDAGPYHFASLDALTSWMARKERRAAA